MPRELNAYKSRLDRTVADLEGLQRVTDRIGTLLTAGQAGLFVYKNADKTADEVQKAVFTTDNLLTVLNYVPPLKTPVNVLKKVIKKLEKPVEKVDEKFDEISGKDDRSTPGRDNDGEFVERVETNLGRAGIVLDAVSDTLTLRIRQLEIASEASGNFQSAIAAATRSGAAWSGSFAALSTDIESQLGARNAAAAAVDELYRDVKSKVDDFLGVLNVIDFEKILGELVDLDEIGRIFEVLKNPLEAAGTLIEPILPLLNALDALVSLVVDPVIDYVLETLGIDKVLDDVETAVSRLLPSVNLLDAFSDFIQDLQDLLLEYIVDGLGSIPLLDLVEEAYFGGVAGEADKGPTGWGNDLVNTLEGDDGDDILDGLGGSDTIRGGAGNDVIVAGKGSDVLDGGAGRDLIYFDASFTEYELARDEATGDVIVLHLAPKTSVNTGIDVLENLENRDHVVFTDISFTGRELNNAIIGPSVLTGDRNGPADDLMFLQSQGTTIDGFYVAEGRQGDDRIFGSLGNDRLFGGSGNDVLFPGAGDDEVYGDSGTDTYHVLKGARRGLTIDLAAGTAFGDGSDRVFSIENVVAAPDVTHKISGTEGGNVIYTGDEVDVISGLGGNDLIDAGGEDDYIIGGAGSDIIDAGAGNIDVMLSGSAARKGVRDIYRGGDGFDLVGYTSESNTIRFDINDQSDDPSILQTLKNFLEGVEDSGPVRIDAARGRIVRFDDTGRRVTVDRTEDVEGFMGSDQDDRIFGSVDAVLLHGAGGDDVIRNGGAPRINGGTGNDTIFAEYVAGGATQLQVEGGSGYDLLRLDDVGDARWFYRVQGAIALDLRAHRTTVEGEDLRNAREVFFSLKPTGIEELWLGNYADHVIYEPGGTATALLFLRDGNDRFDAENGFADVSAGAGNDIGNFDGGGGGIFRGEEGDDVAVFDDTDRSNAALMGAGDDSLEIERFFGIAVGGGGYDTIAFDVSFASRIVADLAAGTVVSFKGVQTIIADQVDMTLVGFEELIATDYDDTIDGSDRDEQIVARDGSDTVRSGGGRDKLFGGDGDDLLDGGDGDDLLHGGSGDDRLFGGTGSDTASYAWARPDGLSGDLAAGNFGAVYVDLRANIARGSFGTDTLVSIENVVGSGGNDTLAGTGGANLLSGGNGDDLLIGRGGRDVLVTGAGTDRAVGGGGRDTLVVGLGDKDLKGGRGHDTLDFGTIDGAVTLRFAAGVYTARIVDQMPRWLDQGMDSDGEEARSIGGVMMTPLDVLEADARFANGVEDVSRVLPGSDDPDFGASLIKFVTTRTAASGTFASIERIVGGDSDDRLIGDGDGNRFAGAAGRDVIVGRRGNDRLQGEDGADVLRGGGGNDALSGGRGKDSLAGGAGRDKLQGGSQKDTLLGGGADDVLRGGSGGDRLKGGNGQDRLFGGAGADKIEGGRGNDLLVGGGGVDDFIFANRSGVDRVRDFNADNGREDIDLSAVGRIRDFADLRSNHMVQRGDNVVIDDGAATRIVLLDTDLSDLDRADFLF